MQTHARNSKRLPVNRESRLKASTSLSRRDHGYVEPPRAHCVGHAESSHTFVEYAKSNHFDSGIAHPRLAYCGPSFVTTNSTAATEGVRTLSKLVG